MFQLRRQAKRTRDGGYREQDAGRTKVRGRRALVGREDARWPRAVPRVLRPGRVGAAVRRRQGRVRVQVPRGLQKVAHPQLQSQPDRHM